ncbi:laccase domain-containing protein, partial [Ilumatobacter sp.]|uniref:laccase domain-containing protein n=1 Tax=Ilumatobacter sp. TaxID=1967498 RepID=UPI003C444411
MPTPLYQTVAGGRDVRIVATDRFDGDIHPDHVITDVLVERQTRATGQRWTMLDEIHGVEVVDVDPTAGTENGSSITAGIGDVAVTARSGTHLAVWTADCAPIFVLADDGTVVGAHGGWR